MSARDPLCYLLDHRRGPCDLCRILAQARLYGIRQALFVVDKGGRAEQQLLALLDKL